MGYRIRSRQPPGLYSWEADTSLRWQYIPYSDPGLSTREVHPTVSCPPHKRLSLLIFVETRALPHQHKVSGRIPHAKDHLRPLFMEGAIFTSLQCLRKILKRLSNHRSPVTDCPVPHMSCGFPGAHLTSPPLVSKGITIPVSYTHLTL